MHTYLLEGPRSEPLPLAELRSWLRIETTDEDELLEMLVSAAREKVEVQCGRKLISQKWRAVMPLPLAASKIWLPLAPVLSLDAARTVDRNEPAEELEISSLVFVNDGGGAYLRVNDPGALWSRSGRLEVDLTCGMASGPDDVAHPLKQAIRLLAAQWYAHRGDEPDATLSLRMPAGVRDLLEPYRQRRLA